MTPTLQLLDAHTSCPSLVLDNSAIEDIERCPRLSYYKLIRRRVAVRPAIALDFGGAIHTALETRYRLSGSKPVTLGTEIAQMTALEKSFAKIDVPEEDHRHLGRAKEVIQLYNERYQQEPFEVVAVEMPFVCELGTVRVDGPALGIAGDLIRILYQGRIDLVIRDHNDKLWVLDFKTMKDFGIRAWWKYKMGTQMRGYLWSLAQPNVLGMPAVGAVVRAIVVRPPLAIQKKTSLARTQFEQEYFNYTPENIAEWHTNTLAKVRTWLGYAATGNYPMYETGCAEYDGCQFLDVCMASQAQREMLLSSGCFTDNNWNPLDERAK